MKIEINFICNICWSKYKSPIDCFKCEKKWVIDKTKYPIWLMFEYHHHWYVWIFAIAEVFDWDGGRNKHLAHTRLWACRVYNGDTLWDLMCLWGFVYNNAKKPQEYTPITKDHENGPEFKRMVEFLKSNNITPQYYNENWELKKL